MAAPQPIPEKSQRFDRALIVAVSMYLILVANGGMFLLVVGLKQISTDFDWPRSVPSLAYALLFIGSGLGGIVMGHWFDRSGAAPVTLLGTIMIGSGAVLTSLMQAEWQLYLIYGIMIGLLGQATIYGPLVLNVMTWFERRRGFAIGLVTAGQGLAGAIWPPLFRHFNESAGWRETSLWFGVFMLCTAVPATFFLRRKPPAREAGVSPTRPKTAAQERVSMATGFGLRPWVIQALLCVAIVGCCVSMSMPLAHLVAHVSDLGHATARAAEMLAVALLTATVVRLAGGTLIVDRFGGVVSLLLFSTLQASALLLYAFLDGLVVLYLVSVLFGLGYGGINMCYPLIVRDHLPPHESGRRLGFVILFGALGMALGGWLAGYTFDRTGSYVPAFLVGVGFNVFNLCVVAVLLMRDRTQRMLAVPA